MQNRFIYIFACAFVFTTIACHREDINTPPTAYFAITPGQGVPSTMFTFDASACTDEEDATADLKVRWDWNDDGNYETEWSVNKTVTHQFSQTGTIGIRLQVSDLDGLTDELSSSLVIIPDDEGIIADPRDGNEYRYFTIGTQTWLIDNLAYLPAVNGSDTGSDTIRYYYVPGYEGVDVDQAKKTWEYQTYGVLYNWTAAMDGGSSSNSVPSFVRGVCPPGWHLPSDGEWKKLEKFLGLSDDELNMGGWRNSGNLGLIMKESGGVWQSAYFEANNASGFSVYPAGSFINWHFYGIGYTAGFWSTTIDHAQAFGRDFASESSGIRRSIWTKSEGFSIRCIRN